MTIEINKKAHAQAIQSVQRYVNESMEEPIDNITSNALIHFF